MPTALEPLRCFLCSPGLLGCEFRTHIEPDSIQSGIHILPYTASLYHLANVPSTVRTAYFSVDAK